MRKIYILPNLFTTGNMFCGFYAIVAAFRGDFLVAAWSVLAALIFDTMDGRVARLTRATSAFGVQYDSLSDLLSFGVAPALLVYLWCLEPFGRLGWLAAFLYVVCTALRLARFNVRVDTVSKKYFQGAPSPLAAATIVTAIIFYTEFGPELFKTLTAKGIPFSKDVFMLTLVFTMASLMVSTVRFPSFKEVRVGKEGSFGLLAVGVLGLVLIAVKPEATLFLMCLFYTVLALSLEVHRVAFRRTSGTKASAPSRAGHDHKV